MAPVYKLTYFDGRGLAETLRYLMKYGNIEFEDCRIKREDWPQHKDKQPFGQVPALECNGKIVGQSVAIAHYLAKQVKLTGKDDWEDLEIDAIADTINDLRLKSSALYYEQDEGKKATLLKEVKEEHLPFYLSRLEELAKKNGGYLVGGKLTWVDFFFTSMNMIFELFTKEDCLGKYPTLKALIEKVNSIPAIKKWIECRPKTDF